jgi:hypothetical protein
MEYIWYRIMVYQQIVASIMIALVSCKLAEVLSSEEE